MVRSRDIEKLEAIKSNAIELIVQKGFDGLSMHKLAKAAGVSAATIYIYYKDREDLILQLGIEVESEMFDATLKDFGPDLDFADGLLIQWRNRTTFFLENHNKMQFIEQLKYTRFQSEIFKAVKREFANIMGEWVHKSIQNGQLKNLPLEIYWSVAYAPLYQLAKFHINKKGLTEKPFVLSEEIFNTAFETVLSALTPNK